MNVLSNYVLPTGKGLGLKVVHADGRPESAKAPAGFRWSTTPGDIVTAPDWNTEPVCGGGLHLWADGMGDLMASGIHTTSDPASVTWLAVEYDSADAVTLDGKIKVPSCRVVASGERSAVATWLAGMLPGRAVHYATATAGDCGTATAGVSGTATAGDSGTATAGVRGTATAGEGGALVILWWNAARSMYCRRCVEVDGTTIKPGVAYKLDVDGNFVEAK